MIDTMDIAVARGLAEAGAEHGQALRVIETLEGVNEYRFALSELGRLSEPGAYDAIMARQYEIKGVER